MFQQSVPNTDSDPAKLPTRAHRGAVAAAIAPQAIVISIDSSEADVLLNNSNWAPVKLKDPGALVSIDEGSGHGDDDGEPVMTGW